MPPIYYKDSLDFFGIKALTGVEPYYRISLLQKFTTEMKRTGDFGCLLIQDDRGRVLLARNQIPGSSSVFYELPIATVTNQASRTVVLRHTPESGRSQGITVNLGSRVVESTKSRAGYRVDYKVGEAAVSGLVYASFPEGLGQLDDDLWRFVDLGKPRSLISGAEFGPCVGYLRWLVQNEEVKLRV